LPIDQLRESVEAILAGKSPRVQDDVEEAKPDHPAELASLGIVLVPDVLERTPPYVDAVRPNSPAAAAGIKPDDLVVYLGENLIPSCKSLIEEVSRLERDAELRFVLMRGQELMEVVVTPVANEQTEPE
jgi:serine protease Do